MAVVILEPTKQWSDEGGADGMTGDLLEGRGDRTGEEGHTPDTGTEVLGLANVWEEEKRLGDLRQNKQTEDVLIGGKSSNWYEQ